MSVKEQHDVSVEKDREVFDGRGALFGKRFGVLNL